MFQEVKTFSDTVAENSQMQKYTKFDIEMHFLVDVSYQRLVV